MKRMRWDLFACIHVSSKATLIYLCNYAVAAILSFQVIVVDNYFTGSKDNLSKWIGHPRFELIRHGASWFLHTAFIYYHARASYLFLSLQMLPNLCWLRLIRFIILHVLLLQFFTSTILWRFVWDLDLTWKLHYPTLTMRWCLVPSMAKSISIGRILYLCWREAFDSTPTIFLSLYPQVFFCQRGEHLTFVSTLLDGLPLNMQVITKILQTIKTNVIGTLNMLGLAKRVGAR